MDGGAAALGKHVAVADVAANLRCLERPCAPRLSRQPVVRIIWIRVPRMVGAALWASTAPAMAAAATVAARPLAKTIPACLRPRIGNGALPPSTSTSLGRLSWIGRWRIAL